MGKKREIRPEKLRDMIRSILPSKNREAARKAKTALRRRVRRTVRNDVQHRDAETTRVDLTRDANQSANVQWRRDGDKLNHFMRWCHELTDGMTTEDALAFVRRILPANLIGDHAYGHWETECRYRRNRGRVSWRETQERRAQGDYDRMRHALRRALEIAPHLLGELNADIKSRKPFDQERRLLLGIHDIDAFVHDVLTRPSLATECHAAWRAVAQAAARPTIGCDETHLCRAVSLPRRLRLNQAFSKA